MAGRKRKKGCLNSFIIIGIIITCIGCAVFGGVFLKEVKKEFEKQMAVPYQKVEFTPEQFAGKYYYASLTEEEQLVYREMLQGLMDEVEEIYLHSVDAKKNNQIFQFVLNDYPEIFWCSGRGQTTIYERGKETYAVMIPEYKYKAEELEQKKQEINQSAEAVLQNAPVNGTEYEKIKYVYEYIVGHTDYEETASDNQNIYSVLVNGKSVCAGYARATQYLLEKLGVFCTYVTGTSVRPETSEEVPHAWNIVSCDGEYYHVDTTWGDPVYQQETGNNIIYDYLCTNDEELFVTHTIDTSVAFPACTSLTYNYYVLNGMYYQEYNKEQILQVMKDSIDRQDTDVTFKFANGAVYSEAREDMVNDSVKKAAEYLGRRYGLSTVNYSWQEDDTLNKLIFLWQYQ